MQIAYACANAADKIEKSVKAVHTGVRSTLAVLDNIEKTFAAMPPRR